MANDPPFMNPTHPTVTHALDIHLVLNSLSRVAAKFYAATQTESDELYALSDYLTLGLRVMARPQISFSDEAKLLGHYVDLLQSGKYTGLTVESVVQDNTDLIPIAPHSSCDALTLLLQATRADSRSVMRLQATFGSGGVALSLGPVELGGDPLERLPRLQNNLQAKCPGWLVTQSPDKQLSAEWVL